MLDRLILDAEKIIRQECNTTSDDICYNNKCKYGKLIGNNKGYLCAFVFNLAVKYRLKNK